MYAGSGGITLAIFIVIGIAAAIYGGASTRLSPVEAMLSILLSILVPIIGGLGVTAFVLHRRRDHGAAGRDPLK